MNHSNKIIEDYNEVMKGYNPKNNQTRNILSKYEKTKILGMRMEQLARNATPYVPIKDNKFDIGEIAMRELMERKLPFMISRTLANGKNEIYRLEDMIIN